MLGKAIEAKDVEFGYRAEIDTRTGSAAQEIDGRSAAAGTQRDGDRAELERDAQNAAQSVSAADAAGRRPENAPDKAGSAGNPDRDAGERDRVRRTGWEPERGVFFRLQGTDREYTECCDFDFGERRTGDFYGDTRSEEENSPVRVDLNRGIDLVRSAVRLGRAVEQMTDDTPTRDGTTMLPHIDSKRRKKLKQKKTALGHAEDDHVDWTMEQHL